LIYLLIYLWKSDCDANLLSYAQLQWERDGRILPVKYINFYLPQIVSYSVRVIHRTLDSRYMLYIDYVITSVIIKYCWKWTYRDKKILSS